MPSSSTWSRCMVRPALMAQTDGGCYRFDFSATTWFMRLADGPRRLRSPASSMNWPQAALWTTLFFLCSGPLAPSLADWQRAFGTEASATSPLLEGNPYRDISRRDQKPGLQHHADRSELVARPRSTKPNGRVRRKSVIADLPRFHRRVKPEQRRGETSSNEKYIIPEGSDMHDMHPG